MQVFEGMQMCVLSYVGGAAKSIYVRHRARAKLHLRKSYLHSDMDWVTM